MEDVIGFAGKGVLRAFSYLLVDFLFSTLCYWIGFPLCKALTLGRFPETPPGPLGISTSRHDFGCSIVGFVVLLFGSYWVFAVFG